MFKEMAKSEQLRLFKQMVCILVCIYGDPDCEISRCNNGRGSWIEFGKASDWTFCNGVCCQKFRDKPIWTIRVLDEVVY